jgi:hypothetical protein
VRKVSRSDPDFQSEVERVHGQVVQAVQDLYNRYVGKTGCWKRVRLLSRRSHLGTVSVVASLTALCTVLKHVAL